MHALSGRRLRGCLVSALLALAILLPDHAAWAAGQKQVLVLYSTRRDAQIAVVGDRELPRLLDEGVAEGVDYYSEYIDQARFPEPEYQLAFREFLEKKYRGQTFDLVITMQDSALDFVRKTRGELFPTAPIVFFANLPGRPHVENSTGVVNETDLRGSIDLALRLQPDLEHVFVVSGAGAREQAYERLARAQLGERMGRLDVTYLSGLPTSELERRVSALPTRSAVYFLIVYKDGHGENFHPLEYLARVAAVANAPTYCWVDSAIDRGIVGGSLLSEQAETETVAALAVRVLRGEAADSIPVSSPNLNIRLVDWRQLRRWGLDEARVPTGTRVLYRQPSVWDRYRYYILGAVAVVLAQTALIVGLLVQRLRRRQAEDEVRGTHARIRDLAGRLLNAQEAERARIARELHDDISQQLALLSIDLELLGGAADVPVRAMAGEVLNRANGLARSVHDLSHRLHPAKLRLIGLVAALQGLQNELSQSGVAVSLTHDRVPPNLPADLTLCLFRIVQEALQNAVKHSRARHVSVDVHGTGDGIALTVADDGVGFEVDPAFGRGLGLISMDERIEAVGGRFVIQSWPGAGTRIEVTAPLRLAGPVTTPA